MHYQSFIVSMLGIDVLPELIVSPCPQAADVADRLMQRVKVHQLQVHFQAQRTLQRFLTETTPVEGIPVATLVGLEAAQSAALFVALVATEQPGEVDYCNVSGHL